MRLPTRLRAAAAVAAAAAAARLLPQQPAFPCRLSLSGQALNLPTCACLLLRVPGTPDDAVRPYTPISEEARRGSFDLLVKRYAGGAASQYLHQLAVGDTVGFKHVPPNVKRQY